MCVFCLALAYQCRGLLFILKKVYINVFYFNKRFYICETINTMNKQVTYTITYDSVIFTAEIKKSTYGIELSLEEGMMYIKDNTYHSLYSKILWDNNIGNCKGKVAAKIAADKAFKAIYNQNTAAAIVRAAGYDKFDFKAQSYTNGASFYFTLHNGSNVRVSDHGVTSTRRIMDGTIYLSF